MRIQDKVRSYAEEHNVEYDPEWHALTIVSEMGELSKEILKSTDYGRKAPEFRPQIEEEIGDVLFNLAMLSNEYKVDLTKALDKTLKKYTKKKYLKGRLSTSLR